MLYWQGEMNALFLRHEGFLGAVGAFLKVHPMLVHPTAAPLRPAMRAFSGSSSSKVGCWVADMTAGRGPSSVDGSFPGCLVWVWVSPLAALSCIVPDS
jgi:hypothetical protein